VTPVIYPASKVAAKLRELGLTTWLYGLNPMVSVVEGFRCVLLGTPSQSGSILLASVTVTVLLLVSGTFYLRRMERTFADVV
jgi:lipopolysaccharide transport system permease protein